MWALIELLWLLFKYTALGTSLVLGAYYSHNGIVDKAILALCWFVVFCVITIWGMVRTVTYNQHKIYQALTETEEQKNLNSVLHKWSSRILHDK